MLYGKPCVTSFLKALEHLNITKIKFIKLTSDISPPILLKPGFNFNTKNIK